MSSTLDDEGVINADGGAHLHESSMTWPDLGHLMLRGPTMKNVVDYEAGWTKAVINPTTGKKSFGGAARNHRIGRLGGADAVYTAGATDALNEIAPLVEQMQDRLQQSESLSIELIKRLEAIDRAAGRRRG